MLYSREEQHLEKKLLAGAPWEELGEERKRIGELCTIIYKKLNPGQFGNPAEHPSRKTKP